MVRLLAAGFDPVLIELIPRSLETRVHSAFRHALVSPLGPGLLLTVASDRWGFLPGGVLIRESDWARLAGCGLAVNDRVVLTSRSVHCPDRELTIDLGRSNAPDPTSKWDRSAPVGAQDERLLAARRFFADGDESGNGLLESRQARFTAALAGGRGEDVRSAVMDLIGLGPGLTPAGDDYLLGAMLVLDLLSRDCPAVHATARLTVAAVAGQVDRTTSISASYLAYALRGDFAALPSDFARRLMGAGDWQPAAQSLRSVGATSGRQAALGIIDTLDVYLN